MTEPTGDCATCGIAAVFHAAVQAIPQLSDWTDPDRATPISSVLPGGRLYNGYRGQRPGDGTLATPGMISVGDSVCTTTPLAGRGIALALMQARALIRALEREPSDIDSAAGQFDAWCTEQIRPWFEDHRHADADRLRRWGGGDVDLTRRLPSDLVVAAAATDERLRTLVEPFARMDALPGACTPWNPLRANCMRSGWRPPVPDGPTRDELGELCSARVSQVA